MNGGQLMNQWPQEQQTRSLLMLGQSWLLKQRLVQLKPPFKRHRQWCLLFQRRSLAKQQ